MSEKLLKSQDRHPNNFDVSTKGNETIPLPIQESQTAKTETLEHDHNIDKLQASIHVSAKSTSELSVEQTGNAETQEQPILGVQRALKLDAYDRTIRKVRTRLNPVDRTLSKFIHNKNIEPISDLGSKTFARPSAILGGGFVSLVGSGVVLYLAKNYGFEYNLSIFFILIGIGFFAGLILELVIFLIRRIKL